MRVQRNDQVVVLRGKDRGKQGRVLEVNVKSGRVIVESINIVKRHVKPSPNLRQAGIVEQPSPMSVSNVKVICDKCNRATRVGHNVLQIDEGGRPKRERVRICKRCHEQIG
ncbi:MAG: 50S ribosomal protein L24 [Chloroflexi bacterium]|nr:50S ribosomal protein L24 [Chloroflexota bacterium]